MKLLLFPLIFLVGFALLSQLNVDNINGVTSTGSLYDPLDPASGYAGYFDADGHQVVNGNLSAVGEGGNLHLGREGGYGLFGVQKHYWYNITGGPYEVFNTDTGANVSTKMNQGFDLASDLGMIVLIGVIMALATVAGIRIVGSGISDESVSAIIKGSGLITVWLMFSALAMPLIVMVPLFGPVFFFFLTLIYTLGIINQVGHPGED